MGKFSLLRWWRRGGAKRYPVPTLGCMDQTNHDALLAPYLLRIYLHFLSPYGTTASKCDGANHPGLGTIQLFSVLAGCFLQTVTSQSHRPFEHFQPIAITDDTGTGRSLRRSKK